MKSVSFLRNWRKKSKSDPGVASGARGIDDTNIIGRSSTSATLNHHPSHHHISQFIPIHNAYDDSHIAEGRLKHRSKSVGNLAAKKLSYDAPPPLPSNNTRAKPLPLTEPPLPPRRTEAPVRPPRPPPLDLSGPSNPSPSPVPRSSRHPSYPTSPTSITSPRHHVPPPPPLSPSRSTSTMHVASSSDMHSIPRTPRRKGTMPELDGIWAGFLNDVDEDASSIIDLSMEAPRSVLKADCSMRNASPKPSRQKQPSAPLVSLASSDAEDRGSLELSDPRNDRRHYLMNSRSTTSLSHSARSPTRPSHLRPSPSTGEREDTNTFSLSLFPEPPPLPLKSKRIPGPIVVHPRSNYSTPPLSPASSYTPDVTPVATPVTPKFCQPSSPHMARQYPSSILKNSSPCSTPSLTSSILESPKSSSPATPVDQVHYIPREKSRRPALRTAYSSSHLRDPPNNNRIHRTTSSDSSSDQSDSSDMRLRRAHYGGYTIGYSSDAEPSLTLSRNYLQAQGRAPSKSSHLVASVHIGYAV